MLQIDLRIGDDHPGESFARRNSIIERFEHVAPDSKQSPIVGMDGHSPAGVVRIQLAGWHAIVYRSKPSTVELTSAAFESYLREKGLEKIIEHRAKSGDSSKNGTEMFSRCAKALVNADGAGSSGYDRPTGMRLELIPVTDPTAAGAANGFVLKLLYDSKPCAGVLVTALNEDDVQTIVNGRTDANGEVRLKLPKGGAWVFNAVDMIPAPADSATNPKGCSWESLWASLTVAIASKDNADVAENAGKTPD